MDTLLLALHTQAGAIWMDYEHTVRTVLVRGIKPQDMHTLSETVLTCGDIGTTLLEIGDSKYMVACAGHPLLKVYLAVESKKIRPLHRRLLPRFARLTQTILQSNTAPMEVPSQNASYQTYGVVVEQSLRRLCELVQASGAMLMWFSTWNSAWHRFTVGSIPVWLCQQIWDLPSPDNTLTVWARSMEEEMRLHKQHCMVEEMSVGGTVKGLLCMWRQEAKGAFEAEEYEWVRIMAHMIAASLDVLETQTQLLQRVYLDPLTGTFNRLYFELAYRQVLHNAQRHPRPVSLLMMDIDAFKRVNDTYGHETGDKVLQVIGQVLKHVRADDIAARYGGDEFVILLPGTNEAGARVLAQRIQEMAMQATEQLGLPFSVTLSIGCATVTDGDPNLLLLADKDMYEVKRRKSLDSSSVS